MSDSVSIVIVGVSVSAQPTIILEKHDRYTWKEYAEGIITLHNIEKGSVTVSQDMKDSEGRYFPPAQSIFVFKCNTDITADGDDYIFTFEWEDVTI